MKERWETRIYLAGWSQDLEYRRDAILHYGNAFDLVNPMSITWDDINQNVNKNLQDTWLVKRDKRLIDTCDILVAKVEHVPVGEIMVGTFMEIFYAYENCVPVFLISSDEKIRSNSWLKFHCKMAFESLNKCFEYLLDED